MTMDVGSKKVYLEDLEAEVRGKVERFAKDGRIPVDRLNEVLAAIDAAPVDANTIDPEDKGTPHIDKLIYCRLFHRRRIFHMVQTRRAPRRSYCRRGTSRGDRRSQGGRSIFIPPTSLIFLVGDVGGTGLQWDVPDDTVDPASGDEAMR